MSNSPSYEASTISHFFDLSIRVQSRLQLQGQAARHQAAQEPLHGPAAPHTSVLAVGHCMVASVLVMLQTSTRRPSRSIKTMATRCAPGSGPSSMIQAGAAGHRALHKLALGVVQVGE
jgi:hypothetical protein